MEQIEHRSAPAGEFGNQDDVDLAGLRQCEDDLAFGALVLSSGGGFFPDSDDFVAGHFGEGAQIAFLSGTGLVGGGYPAIQRCRLSQLNPSRQTPRKRAFSCGRVSVHSKYTSKGTGMPHRELLTEAHRQMAAGDRDVGFTPCTRRASTPSSNLDSFDATPSRSNHARKSSAESGREIKYPCPTSQPCSESHENASALSIPSATTRNPRSCARSIVERTMH